MGSRGDRRSRTAVLLLLVIFMSGCAVTINPFEKSAEEEIRKEKEAEEEKAAAAAAATRAPAAPSPTGPFGKTQNLFLFISGVAAFFVILLGTRAWLPRRKKTAPITVIRLHRARDREQCAEQDAAQQPCDEQHVQPASLPAFQQ